MSVEILQAYLERGGTLELLFDQTWRQFYAEWLEQTDYMASPRAIAWRTLPPLGPATLGAWHKTAEYAYDDLAPKLRAALVGELSAEECVWYLAKVLPHTQHEAWKWAKEWTP